MFSQNRNSGHNLQCRCVSATGHHHIRFDTLVVTCPLPDSNSFSAMYYCSVHCKPLWECMFSCNHNINVMPAAQAVIKNRQQAVCIWWKVNTYYISFLVHDMVEEARILVRETIVILLPNMGCKQIVQRRDLPAPRQFQRHLQPLGVLTEH